MSGSFEISLAQGAVSNSIFLATNAIPLMAMDFEGDLRNIVRSLTTIQAMLTDAVNQSTESRGVKMWVHHIDVGIWKHENILDEISYEALRVAVEAQNHTTNKVRCCLNLSNRLTFRINLAENHTTNKVGSCLNLSNTLALRFNLAVECRDIQSHLEFLCKTGHDLGLIEADQTLINDIFGPSEFRRTEPLFVDDSEVVGRQEDVNAVVEMLLGSDIQDGPSVIAIVGMAGLGKTTLAQLVYKHEKVVNNFGNERIWVSGFSDFNVVRILNEMVKSLSGVKSESPNIQGILRKLREKLYGKRYLLVLDDVWSRSTGKWECLRNSLLEIGGSKGGKIIVTTCSMDVVSAMINFPTVTRQLSRLSLADSRAMFMKVVFANGGPTETQPLVDIGERIVEKCNGLPFTIKSIASLLHPLRREYEWVSIEKDSDIWSSLENGWVSIKSRAPIKPRALMKSYDSYRIRSSFVNENGVLRNLSLTFNRLPWPLKLCFVYCSIFPKGADIKKDELIQLWMAQGYLRPLEGTNLEMEDIGHGYFDILLRSSLFQDVEMDEYNNIETCKMHDHVHDLAIHVSKGQCLAGEPIEKYNFGVQHLSLELWENSTLEFPYLSRRERLRTLFLTGYLFQNFEHSSHARALGLFGDDVQKLPRSIQKFIFLKYLDLSETSIGKLPNSIAKLYNLETLKLPWCLRELPTELHKLVGLRHFCLIDTVETRKLVPMNLGRLTSLRTIPFFVVREGSGHGIEELGRLSKLRGKLHVYDLQHVKDKNEAEKAFMLGKANIQELGFHWGGSSNNSNNQEVVLEGLEPHRNVMGLILECFPGLKFPPWMMNRDAQVLQNLVKIELRYCKQCEQIPSLGHLPALKVIEIVGFHNLECIHPEFFGNNAEGVPEAVIFPKLRKLTLDDLPNLVKWSSPASTTTTVFFPCLEELFIKACPQLSTIPNHLFSFQELTISSTEISTPRIGNIHHPSLTISSSDRESEKITDLLIDLFENSCESIRKLTIRGLGERSLPKKLRNFPSLEELAIIECYDDLVTIADESEGFNGLTSLQRLSIHRCQNLTFLPEGLLQRTLVTLEMDSCPKLVMANPYELRSLTSLQSLTIRNCPTCLRSLEHSWKKELLCPSSLRRLEIGSFSEDLNYFPWPSAMSSIALRSLHLWGWEKLKHLPDDLQHLTTLRELSIHHFSGLEALPEWLVDLSSLQSLELYSCRKLMRFPICRPHSLLILTVEDCPLLKKRCKKGVGPEWRKIDHIPFVNFSIVPQEYS